MTLEEIFTEEDLQELADAAMERGVSVAQIIHEATLDDLYR